MLNEKTLDFTEGAKFIKAGGLMDVANELKDRYDVTKIDYKKIEENLKHFSGNVIPQMGMSAIEGFGATINTNQGSLIDMSSQTVNTIVGQNDLWVNANLIALLPSSFPSFLTSRIENVYSAEVAAKIASVGGIEDAIVNHRLCSGAGAIESMLTTLWEYKLKHLSHTKNRIATLIGGFHGQSGNAGSISDIQKGHTLPFRNENKTSDSVILLDTPDDAGFDSNILSSRDVKILEMIEKNKNEIFMVLLEPILMNNGVITPSASFFCALKNVCEQNDILLAYDEIQTAYGWLGEMSAAERIGVSPNMLAVSKGLTGGYGPLGATIGEKRFPQEKGTGESTNGSDLRSLTAVIAIHQRLHGIPSEDIPKTLPLAYQRELERGLLPIIKEKAELIRGKLKELIAVHDEFLGELRGDGLIIGLPIKGSKGITSEARAKKFYDKLLTLGVYMRTSKDALIIKPPAIITEKEIDFALDKLNEVLLQEKFKGCS